MKTNTGVGKANKPGSYAVKTVRKNQAKGKGKTLTMATYHGKRGMV